MISNQSENSAPYSGILVRDSSVHDRIDLSRLQGVIHLPTLSSFESGPTLHEILHLYANFNIPTQAIIGDDENGDPINDRLSKMLDSDDPTSPKYQKKS